MNFDIKNGLKNTAIGLISAPFLPIILIAGSLWMLGQLVRDVVRSGV